MCSQESCGAMVRSPNNPLLSGEVRYDRSTLLDAWVLLSPTSILYQNKFGADRVQCSIIIHFVVGERGAVGLSGVALKGK